MIDPSGKTYLNLAPAGAHDVAREDDLYRAVRDAVAGDYELLGELGRRRGGTVVYLARENAGGQLVALRLDRGPSGGDADYELTVVPQLDESVPSPESACHYCGRRIEGWARFCPQCGRDISGEAGEDAAAEFTPEQLLEAVRESAAGSYDVLGEMPRARGGGRVYFARDLSTGAIVALRLQRDRSSTGEHSFSLGRTQVLKPLVAGLGADYASPTAVAPAPAPPPPSVRPAAERPATPPPARPTPPPARPAPPPPPAGRTVVGLPAAVPPGGLPPEPEFVEPPATPGARRRTILVAAGVTVAILGALAITLSGGEDPIPFPDSPAVRDTSVIGKKQPPDTVVRPPDTTAKPEPARRSVLAITGWLPPGASILVDGQPVRGRHVTLAPGRHTVTARAPGYDPFSQRIELTGDTTAWSPRLRPTQVVTRPDTARPRPDSQPKAEPTAPTCSRAVSAQDWVNARTLCRRDATSGDAVAQRQLGLLLLRGQGGSVEEANAVTWLRLAADADDPQAQYELARIHQSRPAYRNDRRAYELFRRAALRGHHEAQLHAGRALEKGIGTTRNDREAFLMYEQAAKGGYAAAQNAYGIFLKKGIGTARDDRKALEWLMKAAQGGSPDAHFHIGELHEEGRAGLPRSRRNAIEWYRKGAALGSAEARRALDR